MKTSGPATPALQRSPLRIRATEVARQQARSARAWRRALVPGGVGALPEFLIIGGMRCGTTSLYQYLAAHPEIEPALGKELNYFSLHYGRSLRWYRGHFPRRAPGRLSFEASPYYLFHPEAPHNVAETLPDVKLVVLLRDPIERAYSHYLHTRRRGFEPLSFAAALDAEAERLHGGRAGYGGSQDPTRLYSYASRGEYAEQLERWLDLFPRERLHAIRSEDLFSQPEMALDGLVDFLGVARIGVEAFDRYASTPEEATPQLTRALRARLSEHFAPHNQRLAELLGWSETWPLEAPSQR